MGFALTVTTRYDPAHTPMYIIRIVNGFKEKRTTLRGASVKFRLSFSGKSDNFLEIKGFGTFVRIK